MTPILEVKNLKKYFPVLRGILRKEVGSVKAVDDISFTVEEGEVVALVGESGSGKSTAGKTAIRLIEPSDGEISLLGRDYRSLQGQKLKEARRYIQMVFQDPLSSLNPRKTLLENIGEGLLYHRIVQTPQEQKDYVVALLKKIGLSSSTLHRYPHQFSGGQQQRISIGRALAVAPKLIVLDEATSALDLSIQAQILNLLFELKQSEKLSYLFITHDLGVVRNIADRVLVMYQGKIIESGPVKALFSDPKHPYTKMLLDSMLASHPKLRRNRAPVKNALQGSFEGCPFFGRCPVAKPLCQKEKPPLKQSGKDQCYSCIH